MSFQEFLNCINNGLKRNIKSRRLKLNVTIKEFDKLAEKYFTNLNKEDDSFDFTVEEEEKNDVLFILRSYFCFYVEVEKNYIKVFKDFPKRFILTKEVNRSNHPFTPQTFKEGTIMYSVIPAYSSVNRMNGIPLWNNLKTIEGTELIPSVQINYDFICPK